MSTPSASWPKHCRGWQGSCVYDNSKPDGMPRKVMDVSRLAALGWTAQTRFEDAIKAAYDWCVETAAK